MEKDATRHVAIFVTTDTCVVTLFVTSRVIINDGRIAMKLFWAFLVASLISGCGVVAQKKEDELLSRSTAKDWGVLDSNHEALERETILRILKDPESARFRFTNPTRGVSHALGEPVLAWYSVVYVNAKNSFGGYVGERPYGFAYQCPPSKTCKLINYAIPYPNRPQELWWQQ